MNRLVLIILLFGLQQILHAQKKPNDILIINASEGIPIIDAKPVKELRIKRGFARQSKRMLLQQCIDSTKFYNSNCFLITNYDNGILTTLGDDKPSYYIIEGTVYSFNDSVFQHLRTGVINNIHASLDPTAKTKSFKDTTNSSKISYEANFAFQFGGESKLALFLPKVNAFRKHQFRFASLYYGAALGLHVLHNAGYGSVSSIVGVERKYLSLETSFSHFRTTKINDGNNGFRGPYVQNLLNSKLGIRIKNVKLKIGISYLISENISKGKERIPLIDLGKLNSNFFYGLELQIPIFSSYQ